MSEPRRQLLRCKSVGFAAQGCITLADVVRCHLPTPWCQLVLERIRRISHTLDEPRSYQLSSVVVWVVTVFQSSADQVRSKAAPFVDEQSNYLTSNFRIIFHGTISF